MWVVGLISNLDPWMSKIFEKRVKFQTSVFKARVATRLVCWFLFVILSQYQYYYVNKLVITFGEYYRPGQLVFYKSSDYGQSYQPWHYFVSTADECQEKFNRPRQSNPVRVDQVLCTVYPTESKDINDVVSNLWFKLTFYHRQFLILDYRDPLHNHLLQMLRCFGWGQWIGHLALAYLSLISSFHGIMGKTW